MPACACDERSPDRAPHAANLKCADPDEVSALQTAAVQQELMDAALGCGAQAVQKFNAFQTSYGSELRRSDKTLLTMFKRVYGPSRGDAAYNLFKTNMASKAEIRRVHEHRRFLRFRRSGVRRGAGGATSLSLGTSWPACRCTTPPKSASEVATSSRRDAARRTMAGP